MTDTVSAEQQQDVQQQNFEFFNRLRKISLVEKSWNLVSDSYQHVKESQLPLVARTCSLAETTASSLVSPHTARLAALDKFAVDKYESVESVAKAASDVVVSRTAKVVDAGRSVTTAVHDTASHVTSSVSSLLTPVATVAQTTTNTVCESVEGKLACVTVLAANLTDRAVDFVLPEETTTSDGDVQGEGEEEAESVTKEETKVEEDKYVLGTHSLRALERVRAVTGKAQARLYEKAMGKLSYVKARSNKAVEALRPYTVDLLSYASSLPDEQEEVAKEPKSVQTVFTRARLLKDKVTESASTLLVTVASVPHNLLKKGQALVPLRLTVLAEETTQAVANLPKQLSERTSTLIAMFREGKLPESVSTVSEKIYLSAETVRAWLYGQTSSSSDEGAEMVIIEKPSVIQQTIDEVKQKIEEAKLDQSAVEEIEVEESTIEAGDEVEELDDSYSTEMDRANVSFSMGGGSWSDCDYES